MPGLVDCHIHAEQIENAGANYDKQFIVWELQDFFSADQQFSRNLTYTRRVSSLIVVCNFVPTLQEVLMTPWFVLLFSRFKIERLGLS